MHHKKVQRLYREESLALRRKRRKRVAQMPREPKHVPLGPDERWSMVFMQDTLVSGRCFRTLNIVDDFSREAVAIQVASSIPGDRVVRVLERIALTRGLPKLIAMDNGPAFAGRALDAWAYANGVRLHFIRPVKPVENCFVESFNGKLREECLNEHWFVDVEHARRLIERWREDYNHVRPHSALAQVPPSVFADQGVRRAP